jgi:hypothetical protein
MEENAMEFSLKFNTICAAYHNIRDLKVSYQKIRLWHIKEAYLLLFFCKHPHKTYRE